ncbi:MAG: SH3 domain-containing protein [Proteobacteria bacterium]|nr:SH3 domain-containing protein [Pseudomonadota bacterium]
MRNRPFLLIGIAALAAMLYGCENDFIYEPGYVPCDAAYVIDADGKQCYFGECGIYDRDLRDHYCPADVPFCIEYKKEHYYCGTQCPEGYVQTDYMCESREIGCKENEILCDDTCINPMTNVSYCGSDEKCIPNKCLPFQVCKDGQCQCPGSSVLCDDQCVNIQDDTIHCGSCDENCLYQEGWTNISCKSGKCFARSCMNGFHTAPKEDGSVVCERDETDTCGSSGEICPPHSVCIPESGKCVCDINYTACQDGCFDLNNDADHCGSCENACNVVNADNVCHHGLCVYTCHPGYIPSADGTRCEPDQQQDCVNDETRCRDNSYEICMGGVWTVLETCTPQAHETSYCIEGEGCFSECDNGYAYCSPGMCTNVVSDINNCGACNHPCNVVNATNTCQKGKCSFTCNTGYIKTADGSSCELDRCTEGERRCDDLDLLMCSNNHWVVTQTCTAPANAAATCSKNGCVYACYPDYEDCNGKCVNLQTDVKNCGACNNLCSAASVCSQGKCTTSCQANYLQCNNGCVSSSKKVIVHTSTQIYTAPGSDITDYAEKYTIYNLYGQSENYFAININNEKRYISQKKVFVLPVTGLIEIWEGVNVREGPGITYPVMGVMTQNEKVVIDNYKLGDPHQGEGWFHIRDPYDGYMSAYYVTMIGGSNAGALPDCP